MKLRLGEILVSSGLITKKQLSTALNIQKDRKKRLGEILVDEGFITEKEIALTLAEQLDIPFVDPKDIEIKSSAKGLVPIEILESYRAVPIQISGTSVQVIMDEPLNVFAQQDLSLVTGKKVEVSITTSAGIDRALKLLKKEEVAPPPEPTVARDARGGKKKRVSSIVDLLDDILTMAINERASDIHIEPADGVLKTRFRIDGVLQERDHYNMTIHPELISRVKILADMDIAQQRIPQDGRVKYGFKDRFIDLRVSTLPTIFGEKAVIRILDSARAITSVDDLGFDSETRAKYLSMISKPYGMILVSGPTGSGKTTTLNASIHEISTSEKNIVTIEDPVEYTIPGVNQVQVNTKAGLTFASGLRSILRQDPDIVMVGEIRDVETAKIAVRAALTGHLVLSTVHTNDAASALTRLTDMGVEPFLLSSTVIGVVGQRLVRMLCKKCSEETKMPAKSPELVGVPGLEDGPITVFRAKGCPNCSHTGYQGRLGIFELLSVTPDVKKLIESGASAYEIRELARKEGMKTMLEDARDKLLKGITDPNEIKRAAYIEEAEAFDFKG